MTVSVPQALEGTIRAKRARAAGLPQRLKRCVAMWCDAQRRVAERCDAPRRVALPTVIDKSYASHRRPQRGAVARRLQDSVAAITHAPKRAFPRGSSHLGEPQVLLLKKWTVTGF